MKSIALVDFFQGWHAWNSSNAARRLCTCYSGVKNLLTVSAPSVSFAHDITITHSKAVTILCHCHTASRFSAQLTDKYPVQIKDVCCCYCCIVLYCIVLYCIVLLVSNWELSSRRELFWIPRTRQGHVITVGDFRYVSLSWIFWNIYHIRLMILVQLFLLFPQRR